MATTFTTPQGPTTDADHGTLVDVVETTPTRGHIGRIVTGSLIGGLLAAVFVVAVPLAGRTEDVITGSVLLTFASAWFALAKLSQRRTDQPQRWALVPAVFTRAVVVLSVVFA